MGLGGLCCCHSFFFNFNVSFVSKMRVTGGPGGVVSLLVNCFQGQCVIHVNLRVSCGFSAPCVASAAVWVVAVLQVEFLLILNLFNFCKILQWPVDLFQFFSAWGCNHGRYVCECSMHISDTHGAMALQMLPLPHSCVWKRRFCAPARFAPGTHKHRFACANCTFCASTVFRA